jgi:hypothetical protein
MSNLIDYRTCPTTGLGVDRSAEKLIKANAVAAIIFLAIGLPAGRPCIFCRRTCSTWR